MFPIELVLVALAWVKARRVFHLLPAGAGGDWDFSVARGLPVLCDAFLAADFGAGGGEEAGDEEAGTVGLFFVVVVAGYTLAKVVRYGWIEVAYHSKSRRVHEQLRSILCRWSIFSPL